MRTHEVSDILAPADNSHKDVINIGAGNDINPIIENNLKKETLKILPINRQLTPLFKGIFLVGFLQYYHEAFSKNCFISGSDMTAAPDAANETETITRSRVESSLTKPDTGNDRKEEYDNVDEDIDNDRDGIERVDIKDRYFLKSSSEEDLLNGSGYEIV